MVIVDTVKESVEGLSQHRYESTKQTRRDLAMVGYPSYKDFNNMVRAGMIPNRPVTLEEIKNVHAIFGPDVPSLKGKTVRLKPKPVVSNCVNTPKDIVQIHQTVLV